MLASEWLSASSVTVSPGELTLTLQYLCPSPCSMTRSRLKHSVQTHLVDNIQARNEAGHQSRASPRTISNIARRMAKRSVGGRDTAWLLCSEAEPTSSTDCQLVVTLCGQSRRPTASGGCELTLCTARTLRRRLSQEDYVPTSNIRKSRELNLPAHTWASSQQG